MRLEVFRKSRASHGRSAAYRLMRPGKMPTLTKMCVRTDSPGKLIRCWFAGAGFGWRSSSESYRPVGLLEAKH